MIAAEDTRRTRGAAHPRRDPGARPAACGARAQRAGAAAVGRRRGACGQARRLRDRRGHARHLRSRRAARARAASTPGFAVEVVPGPSAALVGAGALGLPDRAVRVRGVPARARVGSARSGSARSPPRPAPTVLFESPRRVRDDARRPARPRAGRSREVAVARELTSCYEEVWRGTLGEAVDHVGDRAEPRGEHVIVARARAAAARGQRRRDRRARARRARPRACRPATPRRASPATSACPAAAPTTPPCASASLSVADPDATLRRSGHVQADADAIGERRSVENRVDAPWPTPFYVTTPIYYVNDAPHIGHAYTTVAADVLARWRRLWGDDVVFLTGTDEHGLKIQRAAEAHGVTPLEWADLNSAPFRAAWDGARHHQRRLHPHHRAPAPPGGARSSSSGSTTPATSSSTRYEGLYCVGCELYYKEDELDDGELPDPRHARRARHRGELLLPALALRGPPARALHRASRGGAARRASATRCSASSSRACSDFSISRTSISWGIPLPWDRPPRRLRVVRRADQLLHRGRVSRRPRAVRALLAGRTTTSSARTSSASTRCTGPRC